MRGGEKRKRGGKKRSGRGRGKVNFYFLIYTSRTFFLTSKTEGDACFGDAGSSLFLLIKTFRIINSWNDRRP